MNGTDMEGSGSGFIRSAITIFLRSQKRTNKKTSLKIINILAKVGNRDILYTNLLK